MHCTADRRCRAVAMRRRLRSRRGAMCAISRQTRVGGCGGVRRASCLRRFEDMTRCTDLHQQHDPPTVHTVASVHACTRRSGERQAHNQDAFSTLTLHQGHTKHGLLRTLILLSASFLSLALFYSTLLPPFLFLYRPRPPSHFLAVAVRSINWRLPSRPLHRVPIIQRSSFAADTA